MSQEALAALREGNALAQTLTFEQLEAYHVPFDELTERAEVERELEYWSTRRGRVALIGDSGAGKSSVMAAVLGALSESVPPNLVPTRIPVELASSDAITDVGGFGRHLVGHILNWAAPEALTAVERNGIERQLSEMERRSGRRRRAGFSLGTGRLLPIDANLSGDLTGAAQDFERQLGNGEVVQALRRLVDLFRARDLEPFLIFDDTDAWLQLPGQEDAARELATGFFGSNVRMLSREIDCGFVLAVHRSYLELPAYQAIADSLEAIDLPTLPEPVAAIIAILQRRIDVDELGIEVADAFADDGLQALGGIYSDVPDLRRVMAIAGLAVRKAHDDEDAIVVTREAVIAARSQRDTLRGQAVEIGG
jgi:energy-coupling factor transporter ATP-binding protein EcfA2